MASGLHSKISFGMIDEDEGSYFGSSQNQIIKTQSTSSPATTSTPQKKRRNLPGTPNPDAEVIALSPKTLMATNRFLCEVCAKGFQREQNLQLHRRGHNLPWKLKQKSNKEVRKRVYLCPEPSCVHHHPSRALGDLTGIKKHFCRKHGEKKWKCEKCSKRYAVQSDWKAHSKTCGTREYRCDCGTLFSRRDSFITHRAFCDALAQESARLPSGLSAVGGQTLYNNSMATLALSHIGSSLVDPNHTSVNILRLTGAAPATQFDPLGPPASTLSFRLPLPPPPVFFSSHSGSNQDFGHEDSNLLLQNKSSAAYNGLMQLPDFTNTTVSINGSASKADNNIFNLGFYPKGDEIRGNCNLQSSPFSLQEQFNGGIMSDRIMTSTVPSLYNSQMRSDSIQLPQMSATALLQKAAQLGATASGNHDNFLRTFGNSIANNTSSHDAAESIGVNQLPWQEGRPSSPFRSSLAISTQSPSTNISQIPPAPLISGKDLRSLDQMKPGFGGGHDTNNIQDIVSSFVNGSNGTMFRSEDRDLDDRFGDYGSHRMNNLNQQGAKDSNDQKKLDQPKSGTLSSSSSIGGPEGLTRDFLGVGGMSTGFIGGLFSQRDHPFPPPPPPPPQHQNLNLVTLDSEVKSHARSYGERMQ